MSAKNKVNYDEIAADYELRYQEERRQGTLEALRRLLSDENPRRVLEIGCGTCHWLKGLRAIAPSAILIGVDPSRGMLTRAINSESILLSQGKAEAIPCMNNAIDLVYCVNALHHFIDKRAFIHEAFRILAPGGLLAMIGMDPRDSRNQWYIYDFFDGTRIRDLERFPAWFEVEGWLLNTGFNHLNRTDVEFIHDPKTKHTVLSDPFLRKTACSQLALLSEKEYQRGVKKIRKDIEKNQNDARTIYHNDIVLSMQIARKGSG